MTLRVGGLCEGYGGIFRGLAEVLDVEHAWYSEYEPPTPKHPKPAQAAAKVLAHRFPGVPNHGDLTTVDWSQVEPVDLLTFGWPCQPWSPAGKQLGEDDERAIWPDIAAAIGVLRPRYLFAENVPGVVVRGELARVLADLARLGFDAVWRCVRASDVGAPHRRDRFFLFATANPEGVGWGEGRPEHAGLVGGSGVAVRGDAPADPDRAGLEGHRELHASPREGEVGSLDRSDAPPAHPNGDGLERRPEQDGEPVGPRLEASLGYDADGRVLDWAGYAPAIHRWERVIGRPAPNPTVLGQRGGRQLNPVFVEFLMGLPEGWVTDVPELTRNQKLKVLGNGCVPQQVAAAVRHLLPLLLGQTTEMAA